MTKIIDINSKLERFGVASYSIKFQVKINPQPGNIIKNNPALLYKCEYELKDKSTNIVIEFKFNPLPENRGDIIDILTFKLIPPRSYQFYYQNPGDFELHDDLSFNNSFNNFSKAWDSYLNNEKVENLFKQEERNLIAESLRKVRVKIEEIEIIDPIRKVKTSPIVYSDFNLSQNNLLKNLTDDYNLKRILYLILEHRVLSHAEKLMSNNDLENLLFNFNWEEFYKNNPNSRKNIAIKFLKEISIRELNEVIFNVNLNRSRGGADKKINRTSLTLAFLVLLNESHDLTDENFKQLDSLFNKWKLNESFTNIYNQFSSEPTSNQLFTNYLEKIFHNIFESNYRRYFEDNLKQNIPKNELEKEFRFNVTSIRVLLSILKRENLVIFNKKEFQITEKGIVFLTK